MDLDPYFPIDLQTPLNLDSLLNEKAIHFTDSIEDIENLNLFDFADFESPMALEESILSAQKEISFQELFSDLNDLNDLNEIIKDNESVIKAEQKSVIIQQKEVPKPVKRLDTKKLKNKEAVVKYRSKKIQKRESLFKECEQLQKKNSDLKKEIDDVQTEISLLKTLLIEALLKKNS